MCVQRSSTGLVSTVPRSGKAGAEWCHSSGTSFGLSQAPSVVVESPEQSNGENHGQNLCHSNGDPQKPKHLQLFGASQEGIHFLPATLLIKVTEIFLVGLFRTSWEFLNTTRIRGPVHLCHFQPVGEIHNSTALELPLKKNSKHE